MKADTMNEKTPSIQFQSGAKAFKEGHHTNPYQSPSPIRWHRDWQRGYDSMRANAANSSKEAS